MTKVILLCVRTKVILEKLHCCQTALLEHCWMQLQYQTCSSSTCKRNPQTSVTRKISQKCHPTPWMQTKGWDTIGGAFAGTGPHCRLRKHKIDSVGLAQLAGCFFGGEGKNVSLKPPSPFCCAAKWLQIGRWRAWWRLWSNRCRQPGNKVMELQWTSQNCL